MKKIISLIKNIMSDSLYRNSIYLMISTLIMSVLGFVFWMVASRLYSADSIGLATAIISVMGLIVGLSVLGLNAGIIRYLPMMTGWRCGRRGWKRRGQKATRYRHGNILHTLPLRDRKGIYILAIRRLTSVVENLPHRISHLD